jgi:hypothetical protein
VATIAIAVPVRAQQIPWVGLSADRAKLFAEGTTAAGGPGNADHFGFAVAAGDFDGDGADDLVSGIPYNDCAFESWDCGAAVVRFGARGSGLSTATTWLDQLQPGSPDPAYAFEEYGSALAAGDFNGDGNDDLAVGIPGNDYSYVSGFIHTGAVQLHFGIPSGISTGGYLLRPGSFGIAGNPMLNARFGSAVVFGDFNGDGRDDLAIGAPQDSNPLPVCGPDCDTGSVYVVDMNAQRTVGSYKMVLGQQGLPDRPEDDELFGAALAAGDFNRDGYDDLAIGVPQEDDVGAVLVVYGSPNSLIFANHWYFSQIDLGDAPEAGDHFGEALAAGDFDGDGYDDLAIGAPDEDGAGGSPANMGQVSVVYGTASGLGPYRPFWWSENSLYGVGNSEPGDRFGAALVAGDFTGDGVDDLAVGTEGEGFDWPDSGAVTIMVGGRGVGLFRAVRRARPGALPVGMIPDLENGNPLYGFSLAAGDFDANGFADLAIGAPNRDIFAVATDAGVVAVLYGNLFRDDFEAGGTRSWAAVTP